MRWPAASAIADCKRLRLTLLGAVQGVGFRPFVLRLACDLGLTGWVGNSAQGLTIEVEGPATALENFRRRVDCERPAPSFIQSCETTWLDPAGHTGFVIRRSESTGVKRAVVLPDIATCPDCLRDISDPTNRRHRYPFTNCTRCGPRFSIIESLPYDRARTSMRHFTMCPECEAEYNDPANRRFHAQPNACPKCGPRLELWSANASSGAQSVQNAAMDTEALIAAARLIRAGWIVAVKGVGGFHLMVDARNEEAVQRLRTRKQREEKPFATLFPSLESVRDACEVSVAEERLLLSPEAPIVLLRKIAGRSSPAAEACAPHNPYLGVMLPSNPLHHLLLAELGFPIVATSGNMSDEPICTDEREAIERLGGIADAFLVHNRPIVRHVDDSIARVLLGREAVLRRARGYAPLPVQTRNAECGTRNILAVGAHLKNSVALAVGDQVFLSQHIGDLETERANAAFQGVIRDFKGLYEATPEVIAADLHPDYLSTQFAVAQASLPAGSGGLPAHCNLTSGGCSAGTRGGRPRHIGVQHHIAHVLSCMAESELDAPLLGVAWDGTGLGTDGTIWGGEFFKVTDREIDRVAHWRQFRLPGGDVASKEPRRSALGLLSELLPTRDPHLHGALESVSRLFTPAELLTVRTMLVRKLNSPLTSSVGRIFDAVAAILGLRCRSSFEGQAAMELEFAAESNPTAACYPVSLRESDGPVGLDWEPMFAGITEDMARGLQAGEISAKFHNALAGAIVTVATRFGLPRVVLSGGCFQNRCLTERTVLQLRKAGFLPYWHQRVPPNDGGISLGQIVGATRYPHAVGAGTRGEPEETAGTLQPGHVRSGA